MALTTGVATQTLGYGDTWGGHFSQPIDYSGVASYVNGTGELLSPAQFGLYNSIMFVDGGLSESGNYQVSLQPTNKGNTTWHIRWFVVSTGLEVANATNLTGETVRLWAFGT